MSEAAGYLEPPRRGKAALFVAIPVAVVIVVLVGVLFTRDAATDKKAFTPLQDKAAPPIVGTTLDGKPYDLYQYVGRWRVVNFFATWCIPCQREHPELVSFARRHGATGANDAEVVSIVFQDDAAKVAEYFQTHGGEWPVITSDEGAVALAYSVTGVPETYLVDPAGIVRARLIGGVTAVGIENQINALASRLAGGAAGTSS
jgi:cytochrome c biogenesis protein CcmG/thiol:disulfide interchange protein DsbE